MLQNYTHPIPQSLKPKRRAVRMRTVAVLDSHLKQEASPRESHGIVIIVPIVIVAVLNMIAIVMHEYMNAHIIAFVTISITDSEIVLCALEP